ncbi:MFS general substrate transporter [Lyophyllum atratum]|nr:MFS general substrate transporter [Lyophyllum atratum]
MSIHSKDSKVPSSEVSEPPHGVWDADEERRLVRKIDIRCMPALVLLFILNYVEVHGIQGRGNLPNARLQGLQDDLNLTDTQCAACLSVFFAGYFSVQVPGNLIMNTIPYPRLFLATIAVLWGGISAFCALCNNFRQLIVCRFFMGFVEAAFYPSCLYYLSRWYTRKEIGLRIAWLNVGNMLATGLGSVLAAGIMSGMEGTQGIRGWRWIFIVLGSITVAIGLAVPFILADYPSTPTSWLSERERVIAQGRLVKDVGIIDNPDEEEKTGSGALRGVILALTDIKVWAPIAMTFTWVIGVAFAQYLPTITQTLGYSTTVTLLLTFPPWAFATLLSYGFALLGYVVALTAKTTAGKYVSLFLMCTGYSGGIILVGWISSCIPRPPVKRAAAIALVIGLGSFGSIPGAYFWPSKWGPKYWQSFVIEICFIVLSWLIMLVYRQYLVSLNKTLEKGEAQAYEANANAIAQSADLVHTTIQEEKEAIQSFRYLY